MLIDESRGRAALLEQALADAGHRVVGRFDAGDDLQGRIKDVRPDIVLIDMESPGRDILEHLRLLNAETPHPIVLFAEQSDGTMAVEAIKAGVSAYVVDGLQPHRLKDIMAVAIARFREYQALRRELEETRSRLAERKVIEKAKGMLMARKGLSEEEAYRSLRKMAMDRNQRLGEVAQNVIALLELLA